jgi:hypothetical protein
MPCLALRVAPGLLAMTQQSWALVMVLLGLIAADVTWPHNQGRPLRPRAL